MPPRSSQISPIRGFLIYGGIGAVVVLCSTGAAADIFVITVGSIRIARPGWLSQMASILYDRSLSPEDES